MNKRMLVMHPSDNTAVVLEDVKAGETCAAESGIVIQAKDDIVFGHKIALKDIQTGENIIKYGEIIGYALRDIRAGEWVHIHNMDDVRGREGKLVEVDEEESAKTGEYPETGFKDGKTEVPPEGGKTGTCAENTSEDCAAPQLMGYRRADGSFGVRNYVAVLPSVFCANHTAEKIAEQVPGCIGLMHQLGCGQHGEDLDQTVRTLIGLGCNPNIGAVLLVGLGCERVNVQELYDGIAPTGKTVKTIVIQENGGTSKTVAKGVEIAKELAAELAAQKREPFGMDKLFVGLKCGGTDATSGIAANPALGLAVDRLIDNGGSAMLTEIGELCGAEHLLARRGKNDQVSKEITDIILHTEDVLREATKNYDRTSNRAALVTPGNFDGGVSGVAEKALGGILKSGSRDFVGTLKYSEQPDLCANPGLYLMNAEGQDGEVVTPMVAAGAQIVCFTSGRGTPTGFPFVPVIKITGNDKTYRMLEDDIDINAGRIITGEKTLTEVGDEIFAKIVSVANGEQTKPEAAGHKELFTIGRFEMY